MKMVLLYILCEVTFNYFNHIKKDTYIFDYYTSFENVSNMMMMMMMIR
jgi:hypothetical protein